MSREGRTSGTCFQEDDPSLSLVRRGLAEGIGTLLLMFIVTAGGTVLTASPNVVGLSALSLALAAPAALVGLVLAFGSVSGGHFNPLITVLQWLGRERTGRCTIVYVCVQVTGALLGAWLAGRLLGGDRAAPPSAVPGLWAPDEFVATTGLMIVIFGCVRSGLAETGPFAVGTWLVAIAITLPHAYVNPALALGALLATGPVGLSAQDVLRHVPSQCLGALLAFGIIRATYVVRKPA